MRSALWTYLGMALLVSVLTGCGDRVISTPAPAVVVRTVTIDRPVPTPCVSAADIPAMPPKVGDRLNGSASHDLDVVAASALRLRVALDKALALLGACLR